MQDEISLIEKYVVPIATAGTAFLGILLKRMYDGFVERRVELAEELATHRAQTYAERKAAFDKIQNELDACKENHEEHTNTIIDLKSEFSELKGFVEGRGQGQIEGVELIAKTLIEEMDKRNGVSSESC